MSPVWRKGRGGAGQGCVKAYAFIAGFNVVGVRELFRRTLMLFIFDRNLRIAIW